MSHPSSPSFHTLHSLRIKGFATVDTLVDMVDGDTATVQGHLDAFANAGHAQFREARSLWQLTPDGRAEHAAQLEVDLEGFDTEAELGEGYRRFLEANAEFKSLCGEWQVRDGDANDHTDAEYDAAIVSRLVDLDGRAQPIVADFGEALDRFAPYAPRLASSLAKLRNGETNMFTGVMCGSYHDVWMELHEDLILTQGIDRTSEGSF